MFTTDRQLRRIIRRKDVGLQLSQVNLSAAGALKPGIRDEIVRYESGPDRCPGAASIKQAFSYSAKGRSRCNVDIPVHIPFMDGSLQSHCFGVAIKIDIQGV